MPIRDKYAVQDLSAGVMLAEFEFDCACEFRTLYFNSDVALDEEVELWFYSAEGTAFDTLIDDKLMNARKYWVSGADGCITLNVGDKIGVKCTNANGLGTVRATVKVKTKV